jgi:hypothetical protein
VTLATSPAIKTTGVTDAGLQSVLQNAITNGTVQQPDSNRLYILYVEPGVAISAPGGLSSTTNFLGYHTSFTGTDKFGAPANIRYAVIAYPASPTAGTFLATANDNLTATTSHELAEAVTDPDIRYNSLTGVYNAPGWVDPTQPGGEVGDIAAGQFVYLNGFAVQRIADKNDQAMTPAGATSATQCTFILDSASHSLSVAQSGVKTLISNNVTQVSDQGIDKLGQAMVDYVDTAGNAWEYHVGQGKVQISSSILGGVQQVVASQGVSYLLYNSGFLTEYVDPTFLSAVPTGTFNSLGVTPGTVQIDAGTDSHGVNMVGERLGSFQVLTRSDSDSVWHPVSGFYMGMSVGQGGNLGLIDTTAHPCWASESPLSLASWTVTPLETTQTVSRVQAGTNARGSTAIDYITNDATRTLVEWSPGQRIETLGTNVQTMGKEHLGVFGAVGAGTQALLYTEPPFLGGVFGTLPATPVQLGDNFAQAVV